MKEGVCMKLKNNVRQQRFQNNEMSQQELADRVGVSRMTIYSIEKGNYIPSTLLALKIAAVFGQPVEAIFLLPKNDGSEGDNYEE